MELLEFPRGEGKFGKFEPKMEFPEGFKGIFGERWGGGGGGVKLNDPCGRGISGTTHSSDYYEFIFYLKYSF